MPEVSMLLILAIGAIVKPDLTLLVIYLLLFALAKSIEAKFGWREFSKHWSFSDSYLIDKAEFMVVKTGAGCVRVYQDCSEGFQNVKTLRLVSDKNMVSWLKSHRSLH